MFFIAWALCLPCPFLVVVPQAATQHDKHNNSESIANTTLPPPLPLQAIASSIVAPTNNVQRRNSLEVNSRCSLWSTRHAIVGYTRLFPRSRLPVIPAVVSSASHATRRLFLPYPKQIYVPLKGITGCFSCCIHCGTAWVIETHVVSRFITEESFKSIGKLINVQQVIRDSRMNQSKLDPVWWPMLEKRSDAYLLCKA